MFFNAGRVWHCNFQGGSNPYNVFYVTTITAVKSIIPISGFDQFKHLFRSVQILFL